MDNMKIMKRFFHAQIYAHCCHWRTFLLMPAEINMKHSIYLAPIALFITLTLCGIFTVETAADDSGAKASATPRTVYVTDFALDAKSGKEESKGRLPVRNKVKGIVNHAGVTGGDSPEEQAKKIVNTLAESIVTELNSKNVKAQRLVSQPPPFTNCLILEGEFVDYDEGDRMKRAIIGFGSGSSDMQVRMMFSEIMDGKTSLLIDTAMDGKKSRKPGAVVTKNPYVAGAKFILTKNAPEKEIKKLGSSIADKVYEFMTKQGFIPQQENK